MTRKRFIRLIMAEGHDRNVAHAYARRVNSIGMPYAHAYIEIKLGLTVLEALEAKFEIMADDVDAALREILGDSGGDSDA